MRFPIVVLFACFAANTVTAEIIDFDGAPPPSDYGGGAYTEGSFSVALAPSNTVAPANFEIGDVSLETGSPFSTEIATYPFGTGNGVLRVTRAIGGSLFSFANIDLGAFGSTPSIVTVTGLLGGSTVASDNFNPNTAGTFQNFAASNLSGQTLDTLDIDFGTIFGQEDVVVADNIDLTLVASAAVPEPSSFACLLLGGIGLYARRRRRS